MDPQITQPRAYMATDQVQRERSQPLLQGTPMVVFILFLSYNPSQNPCSSIPLHKGGMQGSTAPSGTVGAVEEC